MKTEAETPHPCNYLVYGRRVAGSTGEFYWEQRCKDSCSADGSMGVYRGGYGVHLKLT